MDATQAPPAPPAPPKARGLPPVLTQEQVDEARTLRNELRLPYHKLGALFGVSAKTIYQYINDPSKAVRTN